jgi:hypothetical protein
MLPQGAIGVESLPRYGKPLIIQSVPVKPGTGKKCGKGFAEMEFYVAGGRIRNTASFTSTWYWSKY